MTDGWLFLAISTAICVGVFLNGLRFSRMTQNPWSAKTIAGLPVSGSEIPIARIRMIGVIQMIFASLFLFFMIALCFGLFGPVQGITIIQL